MTTVSTKSGKVIKVVSREEEKNTLTVSDSEMDARAIEAVKAAINKAKICSLLHSITYLQLDMFSNS